MGKKLTVEDFIRKAREVHGDKYDYSKVEYKGIDTKVCIICPKHGEFWITPKTHLHSHGCYKCGKESMWNKRGRITTEEFITRAKAVHGDKYDYSKAVYKSTHENVIIICPEHGEFMQQPANHLSGKGCPKCSNEVIGDKLRMATEEFIRRAKEVHGDKYDYSEVKYVNSLTKVCIVCPKHGPFSQTPGGHLRGKGCPKCGIKSRSKKRTWTKEKFIEQAVLEHGSKYDYSEVEYVNNHTNVCIVCPKHGPFIQSPRDHLRGNGCPECGMESRCKKHTWTKEKFVEQAVLKHGDKYDYSEVDYLNFNTPVVIICKEHGPFQQTPGNHLSGKGCPSCKESHLERDTATALNAADIHFKRQFPIGRQRLDFYLPEFNAAIECQGKQHYKPIDYFGGREQFTYQKEMDKLKKEKCTAQGIKLFEITYRDEKDVARKVKEIVENLRK